MGEKVIIGVIVVIVIAAHGWLYKWMKFKMDEGVIIKFLEDAEVHNYRSSEEISFNTDLSVDRVSEVCSKSKTIRPSTNEKESWCICQV